MTLIRVILSSAVLAASLFAFDQANDDRIYDEVRRRLANDPDIKGGALEIDVKDGVVTIKGLTANDKAAAKTEKVAKKVKGVKSVINQVKAR